jgi:hypothetical protein
MNLEGLKSHKVCRKQNSQNTLRKKNKAAGPILITFKDEIFKTVLRIGLQINRIEPRA